MVARTNKKILPKSLIVFSIIVLLFFLGKKGILNPINNFLGDSITGGSQEIRARSLTFKEILTTLFNLKKVIVENKEAQEILLGRKEDRVKILDLEAENSELRKQIELLPKTDYDLIAGEVVFQDIGSADKIITLNKGSRDGVKKGMPAIIYDRILVGEVLEVEDKRSRIILSVSSQNAFDVEIEGQIIGIAQGRYNLEIVLDLIPNSSVIGEGKLVTTSGKNNRYPAGLLVGEIASVNQSPDGLFKQAVVKPFYSVKDLRFLFLIKD